MTVGETGVEAVVVDGGDGRTAVADVSVGAEAPGGEMDVVAVAVSDDVDLRGLVDLGELDVVHEGVDAVGVINPTEAGDGPTAGAGGGGAAGGAHV